MSDSQRLQVARAVLSTVPIIQRTIGRSLRVSGGEVSPQQHRLLSIIGRKPRTLSEIARIQGVTPPTATTIVTTLENRGWVQRDTDELDRRRVFVTLTEQGRMALGAAQAVAEKAIAELLGALDERELAQMAKAMELLRDLGASENPSAESAS